MYADAPWLEWGYEEAFTPLAFYYPMPPWTVDDEIIGGTDISAGDVVESLLIAYRNIREVRLPFKESQMADVQAWFEWAISSATAFNFKFRASDAAARSVYLHSPKLGEGGFNPVRDQSHKGIFWVTVKLRTADGEPFTGSWSGF